MTAITVKPITGRHVLYALLGFFGVMLIANGIFIYLALSTYHGLDNPNAYERGVNYNTRIEAARKQSALGWSHRLSLEGSGIVKLRITDKTGAPVPDLIINGELRRPIGEAMQLEMKFEHIGDGLYRAGAEQVKPGNWVVSLAAARLGGAGLETVYRMKERLWLKPNS